MLNAELKILAGKYQGKAIPLSTKRFLVGREQDCQLRPNSDLVSRHHCVFLIDDFAVRLRDLGSTNGTRVNGDLVRGEIVLNPGDRVTIGRLEVELVVRKTAAVPAKSVVPLPAAMESVSGGATMEMPVVDLPIESMQTKTVKASDTTFEMPVTGAGTPVAMPVSGDTAIVPGAAGAPMAPFSPGPQQMMPMSYPMGYNYPMPGYAPAMPSYGYSMPQGYPMGMPMMPQPQFGMPAAPQAPVAAPVPPANAAAVSEPPVRLPDPSTTGARPPAAPAAPAGGQPAAASSMNPSQSAADIIKQFMSKRSSD